MTSPKFGSHESNFGYFKPIIHHKLSSKGSNTKYSPVHTDFLSDLSVSDLSLQSYPGKLRNYQPVHKHSSGHDESSTKRLIFPAQPSYTSVASRAQIELYNEDIKDHYDDVIEHQLRTSTNLADKAKYHQFLKAKQDERVEQQSKREQSHHRNRPPHRPYNYPNHNRKPVHKKPISTPGLGHFRTPITDRSYNFPFI